jgi:deoxycytidylate deaminase
MNNSNIISKDTAFKFYKLAKYIGFLFSNDSISEHNQGPDLNLGLGSRLSSDLPGCVIISVNNYTILSTGVFTNVYEDQNKRINSCDKKILLYTISAVEDAITKCVKLGGVSLNESIIIVSHFPCIYSLKLLIQSGITTLITIPNKRIYQNDDLHCLNTLLESINVILLEPDMCELTRDSFLINQEVCAYTRHDRNYKITY